MFETELYRRLSARPGNLFFSPYSVGAALALVHAGAAGATRKELETALGQADPVETYGALGRELARRSEPSAREKSHLVWMEAAPPETFGCHLSVGNAMWTQSGYPVRPEVVETLKSRLAADVREADFQRAPAEAVKAVNVWAAQATRDRIREVLHHKKATQPLIFPSAGCIFRNPSPERPAGRLIDQAGLKGTRMGGALVSPVHANYFVNVGGATGRDFLELIGIVRDRVRDACGVELELEVEIWS